MDFYNNDEFAVVRDILSKFTRNLTIGTTSDLGGGAPCQGEGPSVYQVYLTGLPPQLRSATTT
jgi:hypothetical protein